MAASQVRFKWTDHKLTNLVKCSQEFKSSMEFRNCDSNADKVKWHESVRKGLAEIYEDEPDAFGPASVSENPYKDLDDVNEFDLREYQVKVKTEKEQIKRRFEAKNFYLLYYISTRLEIFHITAIFVNSVYRVEILTREENLHTISPLICLNLFHGISDVWRVSLS